MHSQMFSASEGVWLVPRSPYKRLIPSGMRSDSATLLQVSSFIP